MEALQPQDNHMASFLLAGMETTFLDILGYDHNDKHPN